MVVNHTEIEGCFVLELAVIEDERGWFARTFCRETFNKFGIKGTDFVQMNHSFTKVTGSIRGMHMQKPPYEEDKLIRCISGSVYDVIIDYRRTSKTFLKWIAIELSSSNKKMIYVPKGCAHGFQTLSPNTELLYMHTTKYNPENEFGIRFNDPAVGILWPLPISNVSNRDANHRLI